MKFNKELNLLKDSLEDYEYYPTMNSIIECAAKSIKSINEDHYKRLKSVVDIGAGGGKVLDAFAELGIFDSIYAIEKSSTHLSNLNPSYLILGCDFWHINLFDKELDVIYSNCPFSEYVEWTIKILKESPPNCLLYLVIPERWADNKDIQFEIKARGLNPETLGSFDFMESEDRKARAKVNLLLIRTGQRYSEDNDPFARFFNDNFKYPEPVLKDPLEDKIKNEQLVAGRNLIDALVFLYNERMSDLQKNYSAICSLDNGLLKEFEITKAGLIASLKMKLASEKKLFWNRLFDGMKNINRLLTKSSRDQILGLTNKSSGIDFNSDNAYAVVLYVIRNANLKFDSQLVEVYKRLLEFANVENYSSNRRVFSENQFRYNYYRDESNEVSHVKLKVGHRMVLERCGGLVKGYSPCSTGLEPHAADFIGDLLVIANNLGFVPVEDKPRPYQWDSSEAVNYHFKGENGQKEFLFKVKAFYNRNLHFSFNPDFIHALNIQTGKLLKWLGSEEEAAKEVDISPEIAQKFFNHSFRIGENQLLLN
jgi:hypothetical protein